MLEGRFTEGLTIIPDLLEQLERYKPQLDLHRPLVLYYKIASLYFGSGEFGKAIEYLSLIIQHKELSLREDLQCFAHILNLIAHYEAGDNASLDYQIRSVYHFLGKMDDQQPMQVEIFRFLRTVGSIAPPQVREAFIRLRDKLIAATPYESRPFPVPEHGIVAGKQDFERARAGGHAAEVSADEVSGHLTRNLTPGPSP